MAPKPINRRQFLAASGKTSASIAAGAAIFGAPRFAQAQSPGDRIILALIGAGGRAASHVSGMSRLPGVEFK